MNDPFLDEMPPCVGEKMRDIARNLGKPGWEFYAVEIERNKAPKDWPKAISFVPVEFQDQVEEYLRGIAARIRTVRRVR